MPDFAVDVLEHATTTPSEDGVIEALRLLAHEQNGMSVADLADQVHGLLPRFPENPRIIEMAIHYACIDERYPEVLRLAERYRDSGFLDGTEDQNIACAAAQTGEYRQALELAVSAAAKLDSSGHLLTDCQLSPLWRHYAATTPDDEEAALLTSPELENALDETIDCKLVCSICEYTVRRVLPEKFKPWMRRSITAHFEVAPSAPREIISGFRSWFDESRQRNIRLVQRAIQRGAEQQGSCARR
jgi:hypothetical protein